MLVLANMQSGIIIIIIIFATGLGVPAGLLAVTARFCLQSLASCRLGSSPWPLHEGRGNHLDRQSLPLQAVRYSNLIVRRMSIV